MNRCTERLYNGLIKENPTFVLMLGMCPTLAVTTSAINGIGMGLSTTVVLVLSNMLISMLRKIIPDSVRMPAFIVVVASFVTIVQFLLEGFVPSLYDSLGLYIPLIVVNCIILGRAESYASKNPVLPSVFDGIGMGLGFTVGLTSIGIVRELIGSGKIFNFQVLPDTYEELLKLPGIGAYTAGAIASIAYKRCVPAVDGNVLRVFSRVLVSEDDILKERTKKKFQDIIQEYIPEHRSDAFNQALMEIGALVCVPNAAPRCNICPLASECMGYQSGAAHRLPNNS